jgi:hypothetical protein
LDNGLELPLRAVVRFRPVFVPPPRPPVFVGFGIGPLGFALAAATLAMMVPIMLLWALVAAIFSKWAVEATLADGETMWLVRGVDRKAARWLAERLEALTARVPDRSKPVLPRCPTR